MLRRQSRERRVLSQTSKAAWFALAQYRPGDAVVKHRRIDHRRCLSIHAADCKMMRRHACIVTCRSERIFGADKFSCRAAESLDQPRGIALRSELKIDFDKYT